MNNMYVINNLFYGHNLNKRKFVNTMNLLHEFDCTLVEEKGDYTCYFTFPYHGGQVRGDIKSVFFGIWIDDDDFDKDGSRSLDVMKVKTMDEEELKKVYNDFLSEFKQNVKTNFINLDIQPDEYISQKEINESYKEYNELLDHINSSDPEFYTVESST